MMRVLQAFLCEGGNAPPQLAVMRRLVERGHDVRVYSPAKARGPVETRGARFFPALGAYSDMDLTRPESDPVRDWEPRSSLGKAKRFRDAGLRRPVVETAHETSDLLDEWAREGWRPDVVVADILFYGTFTAAEHTGIPAVALSHYPYSLPVRGAPPLGSGLRPLDTAIGEVRDRLVTAMLRPFYRPLLKTLNQARSQFKLPPLRRYEEGILRNAAVLMMTEPELDFSSRGKLPSNVHYTGHAWEPPDSDWQPPWPVENRDPLVLISFSTTYMNQRDFALRTLRAVSNLPVRALFTTGPALDPAGLAIPANVRVERFVPHAAVLPHASLTITHAGWATVQASLTAGVPLVCIPDARDQPDNAARVVEAGAGVRLRRSASPDQIRHAIVAALANPELTAGAQRIAHALGRRDGATAAAKMIERIGQPATPNNSRQVRPQAQGATA